MFGRLSVDWSSNRHRSRRCGRQCIRHRGTVQCYGLSHRGPDGRRRRRLHSRWCERIRCRRFEGFGRGILIAFLSQKSFRSGRHVRKVVRTQKEFDSRLIRIFYNHLQLSFRRNAVTVPFLVRLSSLFGTLSRLDSRTVVRVAFRVAEPVQVDGTDIRSRRLVVLQFIKVSGEHDVDVWGTTKRRLAFSFSEDSNLRYERYRFGREGRHSPVQNGFLITSHQATEKFLLPGGIR